MPDDRIRPRLGAMGQVQEQVLDLRGVGPVRQRAPGPQRARERIELLEIAGEPFCASESLGIDLAPRFRKLDGIHNGAFEEAAELLAGLALAEVALENLLVADDTAVDVLTLVRSVAAALNAEGEPLPSIVRPGEHLDIGQQPSAVQS